MLYRHQSYLTKKNKYQIFVIYPFFNLLLIHFSGGSNGKRFADNSEIESPEGIDILLEAFFIPFIRFALVYLEGDKIRFY
jgi:hypothetical protein